jgi:hypothetical protein
MQYGQFEKHSELTVSADNMQVTRMNIFSRVVRESALTGRLSPDNIFSAEGQPVGWCVNHFCRTSKCLCLPFERQERLLFEDYVEQKESG